MDNDKSSAQKVLQVQPPVSWASVLLDYLDLKARLLALESKEALGHFVVMLIIVGVTLVLSLSSAPDVWSVLIIPGCPVITPGLGLERFNLRSFANDTELRRILPASNTAPEADIPDDTKRYSEG